MKTHPTPYSRLIKSAVACAAVLSLAACGKGVSIGAESSQGIDASSKVDLSKSKSITAGSSANITATAPATQIIAQGMRAVFSVSGVELAPHVAGIKHGTVIDNTPAILASLGYTDKSNEPKLETVEWVRNHLFKFKAGTPAEIFAAEKLLNCTDLALSKDAKARECFDDFYSRVYLSGLVLASSWPQKRHELGGEQVDTYSKQRFFDERQLMPWLFASYFIAENASKVQYEWASQLEGVILANPDSGAYEVARMLFDKPLAEVKALTDPTKLYSETLHYEISPGELNSPIEVELSGKAAYLTENEKGLTLLKNGNPWYGDGYINGYKTEVALARTTSNSLDKKLSVALDKAEKASQSNKAGVNLP